MSKIEAKDYPIQTLLGDTYFYKVPLFQRSYSWGIEQAEELMLDINEVIETGEIHFLGSMIFAEENGYMNVLDGQQRFSTVLLLLAALRDSLNTLGDKNNLYKEECDERIELINELLFSKDKITKEKKPKLTLNHRDWDIYSRIIQEKGTPESKKIKRGGLTSHRLIHKNYSYFYNHFIEKFDSELNSLDLLNDFLVNFQTALYQKVYYINIQVGSILDANKIFESINHKGIKLSSADLIKNYIFSELNSLASGSDDLLSKKINQWDAISDSGIDTVKFIRHYWLSRFENNVSKTKLYKDIKRYIDKNGKNNLIKLLDEIYDEAEAYKNIKTPELHFWKDKKIVNSLKKLNYLGTEQANIILLAAYSRYYKNEDFSSFVRIIDMLENFLFRRNTIVHMDAKELEGIYSRLAKGIRGEIAILEKNKKIKKIENLDQVKNILLDSMPDNEQFKSYFLSFTTTKVDLTKYILSKIYNIDLHDVQIAIEDFELEHIIPQAFDKNDDWMLIENMLEEKFKDSPVEMSLVDSVNKLGNYTLLSPSDNKSVSNKGFLIKKDKSYSKSDIPANIELAKFGKFSVEEVEERQKMFAEKAVEIWKL